MFRRPHGLCPSRFALLGVGLALLGLSLSACASIDPQPFQDFQKGAQKLRDAVDKPLQGNVEQTRQRELKELAGASDQDLVSGISGLRLRFGDPSYLWSYPDNGPLFVVLETRSQAARSLNQAFADYAGLLADLASVEVLPEDQLDQQVESINSSSRTFLGLLGRTPAAGVTELLSTAFVSIARSIVVHHQRRRLQEAIRANQDTVRTFADLGATLMSDVSSDVSSEYLFQFQTLQSQFVSASADQRPQALERIVQLNDRTTTTLDLLSRLAGSYQALPAAHRQLAESLSGGATGHEIRDFLGRAAHLAQLYENLTAQEPSQ